MSNYLLIVKDINNVYKESTNSNYLHEDVALCLLNEFVGNVIIKDLPTLELARHGFLSVKSSNNYIVLTLPVILLQDQIDYLNRIRQFLESNKDKVCINNLTIKDDREVIEEYYHLDKDFDFSDLFNKKMSLPNKKMILKKEV